MRIHFSGKWPEGWFLASEADKAKNHTNEAKKKKKKKKKQTKKKKKKKKKKKEG